MVVEAEGQQGVVDLRLGVWPIIQRIFHRFGVAVGRGRGRQGSGGGGAPLPPRERPWPWVPGHLLFFLLFFL